MLWICVMETTTVVVVPSTGRPRAHNHNKFDTEHHPQRKAPLFLFSGLVFPVSGFRLCWRRLWDKRIFPCVPCDHDLAFASPLCSVVQHTSPSVGPQHAECQSLRSGTHVFCLLQPSCRLCMHQHAFSILAVLRNLQRDLSPGSGCCDDRCVRVTHNNRGENTRVCSLQTNYPQAASG